MLDLHFCSLSVFKYFDNFQVRFWQRPLSDTYLIEAETPNRIRFKRRSQFQEVQKTCKIQLQKILLVPTKESKQRHSERKNHYLIALIHKSNKQSYVNTTNHGISPEITNRVKRTNIRRQLRSAKGDIFYRLRREINFLQREIRRSFKRSNERQNRKLIETVKRARKTRFSRAVKTITSKKKTVKRITLKITFKDSFCNLPWKMRNV